MKELWDQAILPYNLPLTIALGGVVVFWLIALLGAVQIDALQGDATPDVSTDGADDSLAQLPAAMLRMVNATDVPVTIVLSLLTLNMWVVSLLLNHQFNPAQDLGLGLALVAGSFIVGVLGTKIMTQPLVPLMKRLKQAENAKPVVGETGIVRSYSVTTRYGQVEVIRDKGAPALLNCRSADGCEDIPRGTEVIIISCDSTTGQYIVRPAAPTIDAAPSSVSVSQV